MVVLKYLGIVVVFLLSLILSALLLFLVRQVVVSSLVGTHAAGVREVLIVIEWCASLGIATYVTYRLFGPRRTNTTRQDPRDAQASDAEAHGAPVGPESQSTASTEPLGGSEVPGGHVEGGAAAVADAIGTDHPSAVDTEVLPREAPSGATTPRGPATWRVRKPVLLLGAALLVAAGALGALGITWLVDSGVLRRDASDSPNAAVATPSSAPSLTANDEQVIRFISENRLAVDGLVSFCSDCTETYEALEDVDDELPEIVASGRSERLTALSKLVVRVGDDYARLEQADSLDVARVGAAFEAYLKSALMYAGATAAYCASLYEDGRASNEVKKEAQDMATLGGFCASLRDLFAHLWDGLRFTPITESSSDSS